MLIFYEVIMADFKDRLRTLRKEAGLTQEELGKRIQLGKQAISQYERGVREPDYEILSYLCDVFNVSTDYLLGKDNYTVRLVDDDQRRMIDSGKVGVRIKVYGRVAAGIPWEMIEDIYEEEDIDPGMVKGGQEYFGLIIHGDSMEPKMSDGDIVIVRKQETAENGDIVIAAINGDDATCKKLKKEENGIWLMGTNPSFSPMFFSSAEVESIPVMILGKVVELRAKF